MSVNGATKRHSMERFHFLSSFVSSFATSIQSVARYFSTLTRSLRVFVFPWIFESSTIIFSSFSVLRFVRIFQDSSLTKARISLSRSTMSLTATDWTRPAESQRWIFSQSTGETLYPTIRSSIRRACWALTRSISIFRGFSIA